jgi:hypothetical protein
MTSRALLLSSFLVFQVALGSAAPLPKPETSVGELEKRVICAIDEGNETNLKQIEKEISRLDGPARADLRFRIADNEVEFEFRGEYPFGQTQPESLEYLISLNPHQNHETLLAVKEPEMARLRAFQRLFRHDRGDSKSGLLDSRLCWMDGRNQRSIKLEEILQPEPPKLRVDFINQLEICENGLGGTLNAKGERAFLPQESVEGRMIIVVPRSR